MKPARLRYVNGRLEGPEWLTLAQVCELLNRSRWTIWAWRKSRAFPSPDGVAGTQRFARSHVEAWLRRRDLGSEDVS